MRHTIYASILLAMAALLPLSMAQDAPDSTETDISSTSDTELTVVESNNEVIVVCPINGMIEPGVLVLVERALKEAEELKAKAIIFKVDTFGGRVDSAIDITTAIGKAPCRTIAFIEGRGAISAGAIISYSCDDIIMTPDTNIGASMVVYQTSDGMAPAEEKSVSLVRAKMRALAIANGHNADIAEAMVDKDIELRGYVNELGEYVVYSVDSDGDDIKSKDNVKPEALPIADIVKGITEDLPVGVTVPAPEDKDEEVSERVDESAPKSSEVGSLQYKDGSELVLARGKLLTLTPSEAIKYGLIEDTAIDVDATVTHFLLGRGTYHIIEPNWAEKTFRFLTSPTIAGLLMTLAIGGLYLEVRTPGFGIPGIIGISCLIIFFGSHYVLHLADTIDLLLVLVGICLILLEVFVIPGFGLAGISGMICLLIGMYLSLVNFTIPQYTWEYESLKDVATSFSVFVLSFSALIAITWKFLPLMPFYGALVMEGVQDASEGYVGSDLELAAASISLRGTATTFLRPAGKGRFNDRTYDIVTRGDFIEKGSAIVIVQTDGNRFVVELDDEETEHEHA
jgi:membrane-bound serine protease (ClpP class)